MRAFLSVIQKMVRGEEFEAPKAEPDDLQSPCLTASLACTYGVVYRNDVCGPLVRIRRPLTLSLQELIYNQLS